MALYTFGYEPSAVVADKAGNTQSGVTLQVWADYARTIPVTTLYDINGVALTGGLVSDADGGFGFKAPDTYVQLYVAPIPTDKVPNPKPYALPALEALTVNGSIVGKADKSYVDAELAPKLDSTVAAQTYARSGVESTQRLMALLGNETRDASVLVVGDSTGNETGEWVDLLTRALATDWAAWTVKYQLWNDTSGAYDAAATIQTGTGSRTLTVYNASVSGFSTTSWQGLRAAAAIYALTPDLTILSMGHNEQITTSDVWHSRYVGLTEQITLNLPSTDLILVAQNPETANTYQQQRAEVYREVAARRGYGFIDVQQAFLDTGAVATYTAGDGIHPNPAGSALWANTVKAAFSLDKKRSPRVQQPSTLLTRGDNLLLNADFSAITAGVPDNWGLGSCTAAVDATNSESGVVNRTAGGSYTAYTGLKFTATAAGATLSQYIPFKKVRGGWVTVAVRIFTPVGSTSNVGRVGVADTSGSTIALADTANAAGAWRWAVASRFIGTGVGNCRVLIYVDSGAGLGNCTIDRVVMVRGKYPQA